MALETLLVGLREDWKGEGDYGCQNGCSKEGLVDETEIERSFGLLLGPYQSVRVSTFSLSPSTSPSWQLAAAEHYSLRSTSGLWQGGRPSLNWASPTYIPIANLSFQFKWMQLFLFWVSFGFSFSMTTLLRSTSGVWQGKRTSLNWGGLCVHSAQYNNVTILATFQCYSHAGQLGLTQWMYSENTILT